VISQRRFAHYLSTILELLAWHQADIMGVLVESTYNRDRIVDGLMEAGYRGHLANPAALQQYSGLKYTDDHADARWLAHLLRLCGLPEGYIYPKAERAVQDVWRKRSHLVCQQTATVFRLHKIIVRKTGVRLRANTTGARSRRVAGQRDVQRP
jgi:transposase